MATTSSRDSSLLLTWMAVGMWNLIISLDCTALSTALPTIAYDINATSVQAFWLGTAFLLSSAALQPPFASLADAFGRKPIILFCIATFFAGTLTCALADTFAVLVTGRSIQGAGAGGLLSLTYVLIADFTTVAQRGKAMGLLGLLWTLGTCCGPVLGGAFTVAASWRWIFWINLPFCAICTLLVIFFLRSPYKPVRTYSQSLKHIDWIGIVIFVASLTSFLVALSAGGVQYPWTSYRILLPLICGAVGLACWAFYSIFLTTHPMIPIRPILVNRTALISYLGTLVHGLAFFGMLFYLPIYYQAVKGYSAVISGVALLPICVVTGPTVTLVGFLIARTHRIKIFALAGWILLPLGLGLLSLLKASTSPVEWIFITVPAGIGLGLLFSPLALATQAATEDTTRYNSMEELVRVKGIAAGLNPFFRALGQALGIVVCQSAFNNEMAGKLGYGAAQDLGQLAVLENTLPAASEEKAILTAAFVGSLRVVWWILVGLTAMWIVPTLFTKEAGFASLTTDEEKIVFQERLGTVSEVSSTKSAKVDETKDKWYGVSIAVDPVLDWGHRPSVHTLS